MARYLIKDQRKTRENMGLLLNGAGDLLTNDMEKAKVLSAFPPQCLLIRPVLRNTRCLRP